MLCLVVQLCPTLYDPMDCSLPGSSVHEILQARILEWVAISSALEYYSALKRNTILTPAVTRRDLESVTRGTRSRQERANARRPHVHEGPEETDS